ncbi:MAG TPA: MFS transporter [Candidatus Saccharimonadales bacterium]
MKNFYQVLVNTLIANVTTSFLWFALTFWVYLETKNVLATGIIGGMYMLLVAIFSIIFGTIVDHHKKKSVFLFSSFFTFFMFGAAGILYLNFPEKALLDIGGPIFWIFSGIILAGGVIENMRNIALSTTVTLLVPKERHANANGLVGTVQGLGFIVTSVFSGLAIGLLGMGWTLAIAIFFTAIAALHIYFVKIPEKGIAHDPELASKKIDLKGSIAAIHAIPGLFALIIFSTFNNFIGGVYMALMDPYGLTLFSVEMWGIVFGVAGTGFIAGGLLIAKYGLGKNPMKTLLCVAIIMGLLGSFFTIREWWWLYALGIWLYMVLIPIVEAAEQTVIQRVVPYKRQGRVFGFAQAFEAAAAPVTAFMIAPIAQFGIIPYMNSDAGKNMFGWLLGGGEARGIALVFFFAGLIMAAAALLAFLTKSYAKLSEHYAKS